MALLILLICGIVCAVIASGKGRSAVGWFFIGFFLHIIGLVIILVISNKKEEQAHKQFLAQENRRLREQIRQEQIKAESFRAHTQRRLDSHDQKLGYDTRIDDRMLDGGAPAAGLLGGDAPAPAFPAAVPPTETSGTNWFYTLNGQTYGPIAAAELVQAIRAGAIGNALFWASGMADWAPIDNVPELHALVNS